ncbi:MAG: energy transducer TonB [Methylococcaceae bacterium]|nr:energy transducer TonB [Methylococcaceae bacterium]
MNKKHLLLRYLPLAVGVILVIAIAIGVFLLKDLFQKPVQTKKQVQQITVVQPPPPPPPPPVQKPPEPEIKEEKIEEPEPEPEPEPEQAEEPPPGEDLGVDAEGGAGSDAFGLVGKKGGHGLLGGGGGNAIIYYGQQLQREISETLQRNLDDAARGKKYSVIANIWVGTDGSISRAELNGSSGSPEADEALRKALANLRLQLKAPPANMPQPVKIRIRT